MGEGLIGLGRGTLGIHCIQRPWQSYQTNPFFDYATSTQRNIRLHYLSGEGHQRGRMACCVSGGWHTSYFHNFICEVLELV
jgi:hypothetical protein